MYTRIEARLKTQWKKICQKIIGKITGFKSKPFAPTPIWYDKIIQCKTNHRQNKFGDIFGESHGQNFYSNVIKILSIGLVYHNV